MSAAAQTRRAPLPPSVRVVPRGALQHEPDGPRRGYAHVGFDGYPRHAPGHLDFAPLTLVAEGLMKPRETVDMHAHHDVDDLLLVRRGACVHRDSLGHTLELGAGDAALLAAGAHVEHAVQALGDAPVEALVIMLRPDRLGGASAFHHASRRVHAAQAVRARFDAGERPDRAASPAPLAVIASGGALRGEGGAAGMPLRCGARVLGGALAAGRAWSHPLAAQRAYLCALDGELRVEGRRLGHGDRALIEGAGTLRVEAASDVELLLIELA